MNNFAPTNRFHFSSIFHYWSSDQCHFRNKRLNWNEALTPAVPPPLPLLPGSTAPGADFHQPRHFFSHRRDSHLSLHSVPLSSPENHRLVNVPAMYVHTRRACRSRRVVYPLVFALLSIGLPLRRMLMSLLSCTTSSILPGANWNSEQGTHESNRLAEYVLGCGDPIGSILARFLAEESPIRGFRRKLRTEG